MKRQLTKLWRRLTRGHRSYEINGMYGRIVVYRNAWLRKDTHYFYDNDSAFPVVDVLDDLGYGRHVWHAVATQAKGTLELGLLTRAEAMARTIHLCGAIKYVDPTIHRIFYVPHGEAN